jgi:hypothetical protein
MVDISTISAVLSSLKTAGDMAGTLVDLKVSADVQAKVISLNRIILEAQRQSMQAAEEAQELRGRVADLEAEIKRLGDQSAAVAKLTRRTPFYFGDDAGDPFCPRCVEQDVRLSHMVMAPHTQGGKRVWNCPSCKTEIAAAISTPTLRL